MTARGRSQPDASVERRPASHPRRRPSVPVPGSIADAASAFRFVRGDACRHGSDAPPNAHQRHVRPRSGDGCRRDTKRIWGRRAQGRSRRRRAQGRSSAAGERQGGPRDLASTRRTSTRAENKADLGLAVQGDGALGRDGDDEPVRTGRQVDAGTRAGDDRGGNGCRPGVARERHSSGLETLLTGARTRSQVERAFRTLAEASTEARRTMRRVGVASGLRVRPGRRRRSTSTSRRALASASGLNRATLALL